MAFTVVAIMVAAGFVMLAPTFNNFLLTPGQAYWVWISAGPGGTITYTP